LHLITLHSLDQLRNQLIDKPSSIRNEPTKTPEHRIQLTDDSVLFKLEQSLHRQFRVRVLLHSRWIVPTRGKSKVRPFNFDRNFSKTRVSGCRAGIESRSSVDVSAR